MDTSKVYKAAAASDIEFLKANKLEIGSFVSPAKNTILHIYIISQSKKKDKAEQILKSVSPWFKDMLPAKTVKDMLEEWPSLLWKANGKGDTPLHTAARHGHADIVGVLIGYAKRNGEEKDVEAGQRAEWKMLHETNAAKETALHQAVQYTHSKVVEMLIKRDDPTFLYSANEDRKTPLYMAAERGLTNVIKLMVWKYTFPAYEGPNGRTALHAAAIFGDLTGPFSHLPGTSQYLIRETMDPNILLGVEVITKKKGLQFLTTKVDDDWRTPLHYNPRLLLSLGDKSAILMADRDGNTALHIAARKGDSGGVKAFIKNCPECFDLVDREGRNALHLAVESGNKYTVDLILENVHLSDLLKQKDKNGNTPLHLLAASTDFWPNVLNDPRFDTMASNNYDLNPCDVVLSNEHIEKRQKNLWRNAYSYKGRRILRNSDTNGSDGDDLKDERKSQLVVAALIATVTFAAGFTLPGGYIQENGQDQGYAVLTKNAAFVAFVISDSFGLVFSCAAVFMHLLIAMDAYKKKTTVRKLFEKALPLTLFAIVAMVIAFITGTCAVLANSRSLAVSVSVFGGVFFFLIGYLLEGARQSTFFPIFGGVVEGLTFLVKCLLKSCGFILELLRKLCYVILDPLWKLCYGTYYYCTRSLLCVNKEEHLN